MGQPVGQVQIENERYRLNYAIEESLRLLTELDELSVEAAVAVERADQVLTTFQEALMQLEVLQVQMQQLNKGLVENGVQSTGEQLIVSLFLNGLLKNIAKGGTETPGEFDLDQLENLDIASMRSSLSNIAEQIGSIQGIDVQAIIDQITDIRDSLLSLTMKRSASRCIWWTITLPGKSFPVRESRSWWNTVPLTKKQWNL